MTGQLPYYTLNGIQTIRYAYRKITLPGGFDVSVCDDPLCRSITRAAYCLVDNGDVYFTSPDGIIYYLGAESNASTRIYPINGIITMENAPPDLGDVVAYPVGPGEITVDLSANNAEGVNYERYINPSPIRQIEWRPGVATCEAFKVGMDVKDIPTYIVPMYDNWSYPKTPDKMELPFGNGYYVVQDGRDKAIVFYKGEVIYNGPYNGSGVACQFAYGLEFCISDELCCPYESEVNWELKTHQRWGQNDELWSVKSMFGKAVDDMNVDADGQIHRGNVIDRGIDGEDNFVGLVILPYIVDDSGQEKEYDSNNNETGNLLCPVFSTGTGKYIGSVEVEIATGVIGWPKRTPSEQAALEEINERREGVTARLHTLEGRVADSESYVNQLKHLADVAFENTGSRETPEQKAYEEAQQAHYKLQKDILDLKRVLENDPKYNPDLFLADISDDELEALRGKRVLWSFHKSGVWAIPQEDEQTGSIVLGCDYDIEYVLTESVTNKSCENGAAVVHHKTWYEGTGYNIGESNSRFMISKWREECCKSCFSDDTNTECSEYKCGGGCNCTEPAQCGKECYPIQNIDEPIWSHIDPNTCVLSDEVKELIKRTAKNRGWCDETPNVTQEGGGFTVAGLSYPIETVRFYGCDQDEESGTKLNRELSHVCKAEVGQAKVDQLGGRIHLVYGSEGLYGEKQLTNWAYIQSDTQQCSNTKLFTVIGGIKNVYGLPGIVSVSDENDISSAELDYERVDSVVIRSPSAREYDDCTGFTQQPPLDTDPAEVKARFVQFYPAYLTCPGYIKDYSRNTNNEPLYHLRQSWISGEGGRNIAQQYPPPQNYTDSDGYEWGFCGYDIEYRDGRFSSGMEQEGEENTSGVKNIYGVWEAVEVVSDAEQEARDNYAEIHGGQQYTSDGEPIIRRRVAFPRPIGYDESYDTAEDNRFKDVWYYLGWGASKEWFMTNRLNIPHKHRIAKIVSPSATSNRITEIQTRIAAIRQQLNNENPPADVRTELERELAELGDELKELVAMSPLGGICYGRDTLTWGDPNGAPVRVGTQAGDVYYYDDAQHNEPITDLSKLDKYWIWDGSKWKDGDVPYSDITRETTIFYKASGALDLGADTEGFDCTKPKAIFRGKVAPGGIVACGDFLAVNLNADHTYHKVLFGVKRNKDTGVETCDVIWEQTATQTEYKTSDGKPMREGMVCAGDTYVLAVCNVDTNTQRFFLFMADYESGKDSDSHDHPTTFAQYSGDYSYENAPNIFYLKPSVITKEMIRKYGNAVLQRYLFIKSNNSHKGYLFYNGERKAVYETGDNITGISIFVPFGEETQSTDISGAITGPRYAIIKETYFNGSQIEYLYTMWVDGKVEQWRASNCQVIFDGAGLSIFDSDLYNTVEGQSSQFKAEKRTVVFGDSSLEEITWFSCRWSINFVQGGSDVYECSMTNIPVGSIGDWKYALVADVDVGMLYNGWFFGDVNNVEASWKLVRWNPYTQIFDYVKDVTDIVRIPVAMAGLQHDGFSTTHKRQISTYNPNTRKWYHNYVRLDNGVWYRRWTNAAGHFQSYTLNTLESPEVSEVMPAGNNRGKIVGFYYQYVDNQSSGGYSTVEFPMGSIFVVGLAIGGEGGNPNSLERQRVQVAKWLSKYSSDINDEVYKEIACLDHDNNFEVGGIMRRSARYYFNACKPSEYRTLVSRKDEISGSYVLYILDLSHKRERILDNLLGVCDCSGIVTCGHFIAHLSADEETGKLTWRSFYGHRALDDETRPASSTTEDAPWDWCCQDGDVSWVLFPSGRLYTYQQSVGQDFKDARLLGCCGNGILLLTKDKTVVFVYFHNDDNGWGRYYAVSEIATDWTDDKPRFSLSCCGKDYYLIQTGGFFKEMRHGDHYEYTYETPPNSSIRKVIQTLDIADEKYRTLENGDVLELVESEVYTGRSKPDPVSNVITEYSYERPKKWRLTTKDEFGFDVTVLIDHDYSYAFEKDDEGNVLLDEMIETRTGSIPWKVEYKHNRQAYVYYKSDRVSDDPRIMSITCFRYENKSIGTPENPVEPEYHATAAFSVFYDDPYHQLVDTDQKDWTTGGDALTPAEHHTEITTTYTAVQNPIALGRYSEKAVKLDGDWTNPCDCEQKALYRNTFANVCLKVWEGKTCTSRLDHSIDKPFVPFVETFHGEETSEQITEWRNSVIYINDLNTPVRWDRFTNADPPDAWVRQFNSYVWSDGFWLASPSFNLEQVENNVFFDKSGRLVSAGNNTIFVWDKQYGRLAFDAITGQRINYGVS